MFTQNSYKESGWLIVFYVPSTARSFRDGKESECLCLVCRDFSGQWAYFAVADAKTAHIQRLIDKQVPAGKRKRGWTRVCTNYHLTSNIEDWIMNILSHWEEWHSQIYVHHTLFQWEINVYDSTVVSKWLEGLYCEMLDQGPLALRCSLSFTFPLVKIVLFN